MLSKSSCCTVVDCYGSEQVYCWIIFIKYLHDHYLLRCTLWFDLQNKRQRKCAGGSSEYQASGSFLPQDPTITKRLGFEGARLQEQNQEISSSRTAREKYCPGGSRKHCHTAREKGCRAASEK